LQKDKKMEALRDRTIKIDIPYLLCWDEEIKIYKHTYNEETVKQHIAPHALEIAALWSVVTRLHDAKDRSVTSIEKARLYNGQSLPSWTEDKVKELKESSEAEGMTGISARFIQNSISNVLVNNKECINVFMILKEINQRLDYYSLIDDEDDRKRYKDLVAAVTKEYDEIIKDEVQKALIGDEKAIETLCAQYIDNVMASINKEKIENPITGREELPNERLMRAIEEKIDITEQVVNEFRRSIVMHIGSLANQGKVFTFKENPKLMKALQLKLFEDTKDTIKLAKLSEGVSAVDPGLTEKIDALKTRLMKNYGYCEHCAADILQYASSIFARGDLIN
jgi:serine protein kinase